MDYKEHAYQAYLTRRIVDQPSIGLLVDMGLGKTVITLTAIKALLCERLEVGRVLVIAPLRVAQTVWAQEVDKWDHLRAWLRVSLVLGKEGDRISRLSADADIYIINRENVPWLVRWFARVGVWPFDMIVVDELSSFKAHGSARFKALQAVLPHVRRVVGLTGTPAPNGLHDMWAQVYLLDRGARLGRTISAYRARWFDHNPWRHEWTPRPGAAEEVERLLDGLCVSMRAADYLDLPECVTVDVPVALDSAARARYRELERDYLLELDGVEIDAANAAVLTGKLLQLCGGAVYGPDPSVEAVRVHDCKLEALREVVDQLGGEHAIVYYGYRHERGRIEDALRAPGRRVRRLIGAEDVTAWCAGEVDVLLAHPASAGHGLNLQAGGHHVIWYNLPWSLELYMQAVARLHRQGQGCPTIVHRLVVAGCMDETVCAALGGKESAQEAIITALRARLADIRRGD